MASPSASPALFSKAVSISDIPSEITLPDRGTGSSGGGGGGGGGGGCRPSHGRRSLSSKRLQGLLPSSPRLENDHQLYQHRSQQQSEDSVADTSVRGHAADLLEKCVQWLETERHKRRERRARRKERASAGGDGDESSGSADERLDLLEALLKERPGLGSRKSSLRGRSRRSLLNNPGVGAASDTEYASDGDAIVPGCEVWLNIPERTGWDTFKLEVLKLTHTLRCKGWRNVDLDRYKEVGVERISGALTNAVSCGGAGVWLGCG